MGKKKKDIYEEGMKQGTTLEDFVMPQRVRAFAEAFSPCDESRATNKFTETKLRDLFKAHPTTLGDPMAIYLGMLESEGFSLKMSITGELSIFAIEKDVTGYLPELFDDKKEENE